MPKINQEEYEVLKELDDKWKWIARDEKGELWAYRRKPTKENKFWREGILMGLNNGILQFIQREDEEPHSIAELIEEYEAQQIISAMAKEGATLEVEKESEETEVKKDIEWAIKEIEGLETEPSQNYPHDEMIEKEIVIGILNQLDEPEVLSDKWIDDNSVYASSDGITEEYVHVDDLQNLLVPKQELPVIPKFVANWIEEVKPDNSLRVAFEYIAQLKRDNYDDELAFWVEEGNSETFARAWLDGYLVEEEQNRYVVKSKGLDGVYHYFMKFDDEVHGLFGLPNDKEVAYKFDDKEKAQAIANYTNSEVEEMEE